MLYTQNLVRQLYFIPDSLTASDVVKFTEDGKYCYILFTDSAGHEVRTDLIPVDTATKMLTTAREMARRYKATSIILNDNPVSGQDYMLNIKINKFVADSEYVWTWKYAVAHATSGMTKSDLYAKLAQSLYKNISNDVQDMLRVCFLDGAHDDVVVLIDESNINSLPSANITGLVIVEADQYWRLGQYPLRPVDFIVAQGEIMVSGNIVSEWATIDDFTEDFYDDTSEYQGNGRRVADMEWFYHSFRGDMYHEYSYPNNFPFIPSINPNGEYDIIDIHYYWQGANHAVQKSEKDITLVFNASRNAAYAESFYEELQLGNKGRAIIDDAADPEQGRSLGLEAGNGIKQKDATKSLGQP